MTCKYCSECGKENKVAGRDPSGWAVYYECDDGHKVCLAYGDFGSPTTVESVKSFPKTMKPEEQGK